MGPTQIDCKKCGETKPCTEFHKYSSGIQTTCKACRKKYDQQRYAADRERLNEQSKQWKADNAEHVKRYRATNAERMKQYAKQYAEQNADRIKQYRADNAARKNERMKQYRAENPELVRASNKRWRETHAEYLKAFEAKRWKAGRAQQAKQRHAETREHRQKLAKEWRLKNPGRANELAKQWREANIERVKERDKQWRDANPDKIREKSSRRRMQKKDAPGSHTRVQWRALVNKFEGRCVCCGEHFGLAALTEDHVVPLRCGGSDYIENIQPLCVSCNSRKGARHSTDYRKKPFAGSGQQKLFG